jgi:putative cell wall-binding protein
MLPTAAFAISRDVVLDRGKVWVNYTRTVGGKKVTGVPYSQSKWALESGSPVPTSTVNKSSAGYRTDCSGFASMAYNLRDSKGRPYSECTAGFGAKGSKKYFQISKAQLLPGDMVLASAVWGAPGPHAIIFAGWVDAAQTQFWAMEQTSSSSHNGTILHARSWKAAVDRKFRPYRYSGLEDPYSDVQVNISAADAPHAAAAACDAAYPTTQTATVPAMVIANSEVKADQVTAAALAGAVGGPVLLTSTKSLPSVTFDEIKRLKPKRVFILGAPNVISSVVENKLISMHVSVVRVGGLRPFQISSTALTFTVRENKAAKHPVDTAYLSNGHGISDALSVSPVLAKTGRPLVMVDKDSMPSYTSKALKASGIKKVILLGSVNAISAVQEKAMKKAGYKVSRIEGTNAARTSLAIAAHAMTLNAGFKWKSMGVASKTSCVDALAWAYANGKTGCVYVTTPPDKLDGSVRGAAIAHRKDIGKVRVYGGAAAVSIAARKTLATALRTGK